MLFKKYIQIGFMICILSNTYLCTSSTVQSDLKNLAVGVGGGFGAGAVTIGGYKGYQAIKRWLNNDLGLKYYKTREQVGKEQVAEELERFYQSGKPSEDYQVKNIKPDDIENSSLVNENKILEGI